ncbi:MAG: SIMPL domain-containing protein [Alphaproteobacteria bacterium]|nr:SIMPL domain-containing protein [Alphaproteobacteria bacterium]MCB9699378.1 SIMPL domain-containing protein [Alphaproteobacteria bacterium]
MRRSPFRPFRALLLSTLCACAPPTPTWVAVDGAAPVRTLSVVGTARLDLVPDEACVELTFAARDPSMAKAHQALRADVEAFTTAMASVSSARLEQGATRYETETASDDFGRRRPAGYRASQQINVRTKDFDQIPDVVGRASVRGLDAVQVVTYDTAMVERKAELREAAMRAAKEKAAAMAAGFGASLGPVRTVREGSGSSGGFGANVTNYVVRSDVDDVQPPMAPGTLPLTLSVQVEFDLVGG